MSDTGESVPKIEFKKKSRKPLRKRVDLEEDEVDDEDNNLRYFFLLKIRLILFINVHSFFIEIIFYTLFITRH